MLWWGAGLLIRSFVRLQQVTPASTPEGVISMRLGASGRQFPNPEARIEYFRQFSDASPRCRACRCEARSPRSRSRRRSAGDRSTSRLDAAAGTGTAGRQRPSRPTTSAPWRCRRQGRFFTNFDALPNAERVAVIDEKFAQRFWPGQSAIGKHLWNDPKQPATIVGVVGTVKQYGLDVDGRIVVYRPSVGLLGYQVARTSGDPAAVSGAIVRAIHEIDPTIPVYDIRTMPDRMSDSLARQRFATIMLGAFAVFALVLAVVGVYGVMSHLVSQGTHDIGVRMPSGPAQPDRRS